MDVDIEVEIETDWNISGTVLSIKKNQIVFHLYLKMQHK